ncbi:MAG: hypothetical protein UU81_C0049G0002 [Microgenomates group bacterium GW2011_GWC1_41_8]|uniref:Uncharacterized protein n=2 Tax=Candidatus Roizmaniibacteriota TaxID=1752723 RepID=A0A0G0X8F5_9BACT|nr:MAG: hypothetical protein UU14_C0034G0014 [Candidatus Roizmanbacteria bacterium GW2011_GWB1_40_7]KKS21200.1 MAG: hypothetical protein UU78_C0042G0002 [Candidatus Roizmanbacteria bacterium GW2011_GWC2_41_7]KKS22741.1 MAG: hypothetical protein UU81_C0049G0002 [Microgenomates group bacterium GW2011_GWC1_41_8]
MSRWIRALIGVIVVVIVVELFYVLVVTNLFSNKSSSENLYTSPYDVQERTITIRSDIPSIQAQLNDESYLKTRLDDLNFWEGEKRIYETHSVIYEDIYTLEIIVTDQEQPINKVIHVVDGKERMSFSTGLLYDTKDRKLTMYLQIHPDLLYDLNTAEEGLSSIMVRRLYGIKNDVSESQDLEYMKENRPEPFIQLTRTR